MGPSGTTLAVVSVAGTQPARRKPMSTTPSLTRHAFERSQSRSISTAVIEAALTYGRCRNGGEAEIYTIGWREVRYWAERGVDLSRVEGVEVVCAHDGRVITVYRNRKPAAIRDRALRLAA
jgi:hypothetical protein